MIRCDGGLWRLIKQNEDVFFGVDNAAHPGESAPAQDIEGITRPQEGRSDIGAYEVELTLEAGSDQTIILPNNTRLAGLVSPPISDITWTVAAAGSGTVTGWNPNAIVANPFVWFSEADTYTFTLTSDLDGSVSDTVVVTVWPESTTVALAGPDQSFYGRMTALTGSTVPSGSDIDWSVVSTPPGGSVVFTPDDETADAAVLFAPGITGTYTLQIAPDPSGASDTVDIEILEHISAISAGSERTILWPDKRVTLAGSVSPSAADVTWTSDKPVDTGFDNAADPTAEVTFASPGTYTLTLSTARDPDFTDTVVVTVKEPIASPPAPADPEGDRRSGGCSPANTCGMGMIISLLCAAIALAASRSCR